MEAIWFKEFRLYTSFDRALWCAPIWPFILALNPLFLEAGESLSTAMIDAPGFALLFSLCVDYNHVRRLPVRGVRADRAGRPAAARISDRETLVL